MLAVLVLATTFLGLAILVLAIVFATALLGFALVLAHAVHGRLDACFVGCLVNGLDAYL